ncbi:MAG: hypothetical protein HZA04_04965 [Nitrospinae bacterium]|nr:hypothetical protein [Nitrospinota bacterium]
MAEKKMSAEEEFLEKLEVFSVDLESCLQFFQISLTVDATAASDSDLLNAINKAPHFWKTVMGALQTSFFIALGRVFDPDSRSHSIEKLLEYARKNQVIFSKDSLAERKRRDNISEENLRAYLSDVHVPSKKDFDELEELLNRLKEVFGKYQPIRHKVFAHSDHERDVEALFKNTNIIELEQLVGSLQGFYEALWQMFHNGRNPLPLSTVSNGVMDRVKGETENLLKTITDATGRCEFIRTSGSGEGCD